jgi:hypothetical protein
VFEDWVTFSDILGKLTVYFYGVTNMLFWGIILRFKDNK